MVDFWNFFLMVILFIGTGWFAYMSSVLVGERKERQRLGITDYHDNPISKGTMYLQGKSNAKQNTNGKRSQTHGQKLQRQSQTKTTTSSISAKGKRVKE